MEKFLACMTPCLLGSIYFFGWRVLAMLIWVSLWGCFTEYVLARKRKDPVTEAVLVSCILFSLSLPPTFPFWMASVGIVVGISFGKELFGGFGRNIFNPAIVGRAFVYVCFPIAATARFTPVWKGGWAGFAHWGPSHLYDGVAAISAATPMWARRDYGHTTALGDLVLGHIGKTFTGGDGIVRVLGAGSVGEVSAALILLSGALLLWTKTANWRLVASSLAGASLATLFFRHALGATAVPPLLWSLSSGALLYACFFMVTDPVSAPNHKLAQYWYGAMIGALIIFFRWKAVFAGGVAFAILLGNTTGPTIELLCKAYERRQKAAKQANTSQTTTSPT